MKAICVKNSRNMTSATSFKMETRPDRYDLTIGKVYEILLLPEFAPNILPKKCIVIDDFRKNIHAPYELFKPIEEYRDEQIEQILK
jgi:hypothetical protein